MVGCVGGEEEREWRRSLTIGHWLMRDILSRTSCLFWVQRDRVEGVRPTYIPAVRAPSRVHSSWPRASRSSRVRGGV